MDAKREKEVEGRIQEHLLQIALELESAAGGARAAAAAIRENRRGEGFPHVQQLYTRLSEANRMLDSLKRVIDEAVVQNLNP